MAAVHVTTTNNAGHTATLLLDDERDAERIEYLKTLVRREDLADVKVKSAKGEAESSSVKKAARQAAKSE